jgi:signal transduction histidine kinase
VVSVRVRIVVVYLMLVATALLIAVVVTRQVQLLRADREFEREQAQEVEELRRLADGVNPETTEPFADDVEAVFLTFLRRNVPSDDEAFYTLIDGTGFRYSNGSPRLFDDPQFLPLWRVTAPTTSTTTSSIDDVGEVRSLAVPIMSSGEIAGVFVVASFPQDDYREVDQLVAVISLVGVAVLIVTTALAASLATRVLRPVRDLTATAKQITESDLSARIPVEGHDELAELGATFNDMVGRLEHGFTSQRRFLDDVAHELRTPITIARGHLDLLGDDPAERAETVEIVTDELDRMGRYVTDLLLLAKAEQPDFLVTEPIDLGELIRDVHQRVRALGSRSWALDAAPPPGGAIIVADSERLAQAVINLASNACQHTEDDDEIGVGATASGGQARIWVRDTGPGIDPSVADTLFDRHSRAATSRVRRPDGSGIGLSIVDAIARAHGGAVEVESQPGRGARFIVTIPTGRAAPSRLETWAPPVARQPHATAHAAQILDRTPERTSS